MSTYDDRLTALEQKMTTLTHDLVATQSDFFTHMGGFGRSIATLNKAISDQEIQASDLHHNMTILLGVVGNQGQDIKAIKEDLRVVKADVDSIKVDLGTVKASVKEDIAALETRVEARITAMETRMLDSFKQLLTVIDSRLPPPKE